MGRFSAAIARQSCCYAAFFGGRALVKLIMPAPADAHAVPEPSQWENRQLFLVGANQKRPSYQRSEDDYDAPPLHVHIDPGDGARLVSHTF